MSLAGRYPLLVIAAARSPAATASLPCVRATTALNAASAPVIAEIGYAHHVSQFRRTARKLPRSRAANVRDSP